MSLCTELTENASAGVAPALRAVDCLANQTTSAAFGRLFGTDGALLPALTIILTLYIAFFAFSLLTGRSRIGISALTPRMMTLGLVLTFATSWVAYQGVVWNLAVGAPDQIAGVLMGAKGSATQLFGDRIDLIFAAIAQIGEETRSTAQAAGQQVAQGSFTPNNLMWLAALLLLLGTVGVLVTARIALAVLLALGPVFVIFALFSGTKGLTAGWLRGVVLTAVTPLFVVLGGGIMLELLVPIVSNLRGENGVDGRAALALFTIAAVHVALMGMVLKVIGSMVAGWQVFGLAQRETTDAKPMTAVHSPNLAGAIPAVAQTPAAVSSRRPLVTRAAAAQSTMGEAQSVAPASVNSSRTRTIVSSASGAVLPMPPLSSARARGVGSRFRAPLRPAREISR